MSAKKTATKQKPAQVQTPQTRPVRRRGNPALRVILGDARTASHALVSRFRVDALGE